MPRRYIPLEPPEPGSDRWNEPNLSVTETVKQHVVARSYLAGFAAPDGNLDGLNMETGKAFRGPPDSIGFRRGFNDVGKLESGEAVSTEGWLGDIESAALPILRALDDDPDLLVSLDAQQERALTRYLVAQMFRVPAFRDLHWGTMRQLGERMKPGMKTALMNQMGLSESAADDYINRMSETDEWAFLGDERDDTKEAQLAAWMLGEIDGYANMLMAMPWRIGKTSLPMYTSDNPVSSVASPLRETATGIGFPEKTYYFPVSPSTLLVLEPWEMPEEGTPEPETVDDIRGTRRRTDFNRRDSSVARHVISWKATKFLYGTPPYIARDQAVQRLAEIQTQEVKDAVRYRGIDPILPFKTPVSHTMPSFLGSSPPRFHEVATGLYNFLEYKKPIQDLRAWSEELNMIAELESSSPGRKEAIYSLLIAMFSPSASELDLRDSVKLVLTELQVDGFSQHVTTSGAGLD